MAKTTLLVLLLGCIFFLDIDCAVIVSKQHGNAVELHLNNGLNFGKWGTVEYCPEGSFGQDLEAMFQEYSLLQTDETALNALKIYCSTPEEHHEGYITSTIGEKGEWKGMRTCPTGLMTGMRAQVLAYKGALSDDVAVQNVEMQCNYGESYVMALDETLKIKPGEWSEWAECDRNTAICGLQIRYEKPSTIVLDTTGVSDMIMFCCPVDQHSTTVFTTAGPSTAAPSTSEPSTAVPSTAEPSTAVPSTAEPSTAEPSTYEPSTAAPSTAAPSTYETSTSEPSTAAPSTAEPSTAAPSTYETSTAEPTYDSTPGEPSTTITTTMEPSQATQFSTSPPPPQY